jgi:ribosomal protein L30/L7E
MYVSSVCCCKLQVRSLVHISREHTLCLSSLCLERRKNKLLCFDYFSPVVFQLIVKSRAFSPLMFLGHPSFFLP